MTLIGVPRESAAGERRVALVPKVVERRHAAGLAVVVETGAGTGALIPDEQYEQAGATIGDPWPADLVVKAIIERPSRVATRTGIFAATLNALAPKAYEVIMNTAFEMFPDSAAAKGDRKAMRGATAGATNEQIAFAAIMRGVHW